MRIQFALLPGSVLLLLSACASICQVASEVASAPPPLRMGRQEPHIDNPLPQLNRIECHATEDLDRLVEAEKTHFSRENFRWHCTGINVD
jgi:hypothetical protein